MQKTIRLTDIMLFGNGHYEKIIYGLYDHGFEWIVTCEGMPDIHVERERCLRFREMSGAADVLFGSSTGECFEEIEMRKKGIAPVFEKWGIDLSKLSSFIERRYVKAKEKKEKFIEYGSELDRLCREMKEIREYYANYGSDALKVSEHRWSFYLKCLPFIVGQEFYEKNGKDDERTNNNNSELLARESEFLETRKNTPQEYLTVKTGELLLFGELKGVTFKGVTTEFGRGDFEIDTITMELPPFIRIIDHEGNTVTKTNKKAKAYWFAPKSKFLIVDEDNEENVSVNTSPELCFAKLLERRKVFMDLFSSNTQETMNLLCECIERNCSYNKTMYDDSLYKDNKEGEVRNFRINLGYNYYISGGQSHIDSERLYQGDRSFAATLVNEQKNYKALPKIRQQDYDNMSEEERRHFRETYHWDQAPQPGITKCSHQPQIGENAAKTDSNVPSKV